MLTVRVIVQLKHMDTFDLKKSYINANYDACVEKKLNVVSSRPTVYPPSIPLFCTVCLLVLSLSSLFP